MKLKGHRDFNCNYNGTYDCLRYASTQEERSGRPQLLHVPPTWCKLMVYYEALEEQELHHRMGGSRQA